MGTLDGRNKLGLGRVGRHPDIECSDSFSGGPGISAFTQCVRGCLLIVASYVTYRAFGRCGLEFSDAIKKGCDLDKHD